MSAADIVPWLPVLNFLIVPAVLAALRLVRSIDAVSAALAAHIELDRVQHTGIERELERVDDSAQQAHRRIDSGLQGA